MSMAANRRAPQGFGGCVAYGPPFGIGLPVDPPEGRPLVIVHPAAAAHHHASFGLVSDAGHPFIHVVVDYGEYTPDGWGINANEAGMATWQRISDTSQGYPVYRKAALSTPHWQVHIQHEAFSTLTASPPVDVLYVDWLEWLDPHSTGDDRTFPHLISAYVHKIREGGLVVLDLKHSPTSWRVSTHGLPRAVKPCFTWTTVRCWSTKVPSSGCLPTSTATCKRTAPACFRSITVWQVPLAQKHWDDAMQPWFWTTVPEVSMSPAQVNALLAQQAKPPVHPDAPTQEQWMRDWMRYHDEHESGPMFLGPTPPAQPWPARRL